MAKEKQQKYNRNEALDALDAIRGKYSAIQIRDIEKFAPVYYPIAIMEMKLEEQTFEDFETVQLTVLRLVALGITDDKVIARSLGLSPNYVFKIMRLLTGYGHLSGNQLTELGRESLRNEKKITTTQTLQKFQMDALNGTLLKVGQAVTENALNDKSETIRIIGHLNYPDGISAEALSNQLAGQNCENYLHQKSGILHTNVTAIRDARCTQIQYAKGYLLKLRGVECPIVFAKRYDKNQKDMKDRFSWQPFSVNSSQIISRYGLEPDTKISTPHANSYITQLYTMMVEHSQKVELNEEIPRAVTRIYPFNPDGLEIRLPSGTSAAHVDINDEAITQYRSVLVNILLGIARDGAYIITNEYLFGHVIFLRTAGSELTKLSKLLLRKLETHNKLDISKALREYFREYSGEESVVSVMSRVIEEL